MKKGALHKVVLGSVFISPMLIQAAEKPNFVFIIADDVSVDDFGCYGNNVVKTQNIDKLAREGIRFTNAYLTASSSSPSHCSIISGRYPHSTGAAELHTPLPESIIPFPLLLKKSNYYTAHAGKWHFGPSVHRAFDRIRMKTDMIMEMVVKITGYGLLEKGLKTSPFFSGLLHMMPTVHGGRILLKLHMTRVM
jgi:hypothetical protein